MQKEVRNKPCTIKVRVDLSSALLLIDFDPACGSLGPGVVSLPWLEGERGFCLCNGSVVVVVFRA